MYYEKKIIIMFPILKKYHTDEGRVFSCSDTFNVPYPQKHT